MRAFAVASAVTCLSGCGHLFAGVVDGVGLGEDNFGDGDKRITLLEQRFDDGWQRLRSVKGGIVKEDDGPRLYLRGHPLDDLRSGQVLPVQTVTFPYRFKIRDGKCNRNALNKKESKCRNHPIGFLHLHVPDDLGAVIRELNLFDKLRHHQFFLLKSQRGKTEPAHTGAGVFKLLRLLVKQFLTRLL